EKALRRGRYEVRFDSAFADVVRACAQAPRPGQEGTWITEAIQQAYTELHRRGYAHSAEAWQEGRLVGGLYGVSIGGAFFGESMSACGSDPSKGPFVALVERLREWQIELIDSQVHTDHVARFGAELIPR